MKSEQSSPPSLLKSLTLLAAKFTSASSLLLLVSLNQTGLAQSEIAFTSEQVVNGKALYQEHCQICHGTRLSNGQFGTPLKGSYFRNNWAGKSIGELLTFTYDSMPPDNKQALPPEQYAEILAYLFENNKLVASDVAISGEIEELNKVMLPW